MTDVSKPEVSQSPGERKLTSWVYFIRAGEDGPIKIGYTAGSPHVRMRSLQTGNPERLRLLGAVPGMPAHEAALHERFADLRCEGEWFRPETRLVAFVEGALWRVRDLPQMGTHRSAHEIMWVFDVTVNDAPSRILDAVLILQEIVLACRGELPGPDGPLLRAALSCRLGDVHSIGDRLSQHLWSIGVDTGIHPDAFIPF